MQRSFVWMAAALFCLMASYQQAICAPGGKIETIKIVNLQGFSWSGVPKSLTEESLVFWRKPDGSDWKIPVKNLTPDSLERARAYLRKAAEEDRLRKAERLHLDEIRSHLNAYKLNCRYGAVQPHSLIEDSRVTLYSSIEDCKVELNKNGSGGLLIAPDKSVFRFEQIDMPTEVKTMFDLWECMIYRYDARLRNQTEERKRKIKEAFNEPELVRYGGLEGWESKNEDPTTRVFFLLLDGRGFEFEHSSKAGAELRKKPENWDIDFAEWEKILKTLRIEYNLKD